jgi:hypothetical protein
MFCCSFNVGKCCDCAQLLRGKRTDVLLIRLYEAEVVCYDSRKNVVPRE